MGTTTIIVFPDNLGQCFRDDGDLLALAYLMMIQNGIADHSLAALGLMIGQ